MNGLIWVRPELPKLWQSPRLQRLIAGIFGLIMFTSTLTLFNNNSELAKLFFLFVGITLLELSYRGGPVRTAVATNLGSYLGLAIMYLL